MSIKIIVGVVLLGAISVAGWIVLGESKSQVPETFQYAEGMPCHSMGDFYMGDCEFDKDGKPTNL